jgi:DNA-binding XRE family transcriptional regulator
MGHMVGAVTAVYENPAALAKAIREARGTMSQQALADWLGRDKKTIGRWEAGETGSLGDTPEKRRAVAILVAEATGRRDILGLSGSEPREVDQAKRELLDEVEAVRAELNAEFDQVWRALGQPRPKPLPGSPE